MLSEVICTTHKRVPILLAILLVTACKAPVEPLPEPRKVKPKLVDSTALFTNRAIGESFSENPWITHVKVTDLNQNGRDDILACEGRDSKVIWLELTDSHGFVETTIAENMNAPVHAETADLDADGDLDVIVSTMGEIFPNNDKIGSLIVLENDGNQNFTKRTLLENVARVTDARAGDFNQDGHLDLAVAQFGYDQGEVRWMERTGSWEYKSHILLNLSGATNVCLADFDNNDTLDFVALMTQQWEEIHLFSNDGKGNFSSKIIYGSTNEEFNSSWINLCDLNQDGREDILYSNGDGFGPTTMPGPRPWHGVQWLENEGNGNFKYHHIGKLPGAYSPVSVDINEDGALDVVALSCFNDWFKPEHVSVMLFENDGSFNFSPKILAFEPTHQLSLQLGDFDGSGQISFVTGGFHAYPPYENLSRLTLWKRNSNP